MYIDTKHNSLLVALANVYLNLTTTAMKMHNYIGALELRPPAKFIQGLWSYELADEDLIEQVFRLQFTLTRSHLKAWPGSSCVVSEDQVRWFELL